MNVIESLIIGTRATIDSSEEPIMKTNSGHY